MAKKGTKPNQKLQAWIDARQRYRLTHTQVQMAREMGMNPRNLGSLDNHSQEPWKVPLKQYVERLYLKRFGREQPKTVLSIQEQVRGKKEKKAEKREPKQQARQIATEKSLPEENDS
ncbi:MAG: hypothetical protein AB1733_19140 [Thermodesulfobacteriota bacterium]